MRKIEEVNKERKSELQAKEEVVVAELVEERKDRKGRWLHIKLEPYLKYQFRFSAKTGSKSSVIFSYKAEGCEKTLMKKNDQFYFG